MTSRGPLHTEHIVISFHIIANLSCNISENDKNGVDTKQWGACPHVSKQEKGETKILGLSNSQENAAAGSIS